MTRTSFLWLEITGRCQLECRHCYATSGPAGTHGVMSSADWVGVLDQAADLGTGMVQFIGGEPTLHPDLATLIEHSLALGLTVEVFSNLVHVTDELWEVFARPGVSLATSYYSDDPAEHAVITGRPSYARTKANITRAVERGIPLRAGVIDLGGGQRTTEAHAELAGVGVSSIGYDRLRQVGRGVVDQRPGVDQLCGQCGDGVAAISPDGAVWPCVFARWLPMGNVRQQVLAAILGGSRAHRVRGELARAFADREPVTGPWARECAPTCNPCQPRCEPGCQPYCNPAPCQPTCSPSCSPTCGPTLCRPRECWPPMR